MIKQFMAKTCAFDAEWVPLWGDGAAVVGAAQGDGGGT